MARSWLGAVLLEPVLGAGERAEAGTTEALPRTWYAALLARAKVEVVNLDAEDLKRLAIIAGAMAGCVYKVGLLFVVELSLVYGCLPEMI